MSLLDRKPMLEGVRVVDLTSVVFGPYCTQVLVDLGAEVTKVEPPQGDAFRFSGKAPTTAGMSPGHMALNAGKRSVVLDLKTPGDLATLQVMLKEADVFVHNVRLKAIERLGLGPAAVAALNPGIVYAHCVGFASGGPYSDLQAYDDVIQAATGTTTLNSRVDGDPRPRYIPSLIADKVAGLHAAYAVLAALVHKLRTGDGQVVEIPMFEAFNHFMLREHLAGLTFEPPVGPVCYSRQIDAQRQPFPTADGYVSIVPYDDASWSTTFAVLGAPEVLADPRFAGRRERARNVSALYQAIAERTPARETDHWVQAFRAVSVPAMAVRDMADIRDDPHLAATGAFVPRHHPTEGGYHEVAPPVRFGVAFHRSTAPAPNLGADTAAVRAEFDPGTPAAAATSVIAGARP